MQKTGFLIKIREWLRFRGTKRQAQITTFIILFLAIVALFAAVFINISKIAVRRAVVLNAATGAALQLASNLSSYGRMLAAAQFGNGDRDKKCKFSWLAIIMLIVLIILIIIAIIFPPTWAGVGLIGLAAVGAAVSTVVSLILKYTTFDPKMYAAMNKAFAKMSLNQQFTESAIRYAFLNTVDDHAEVADLNDMDMDGKFGFKRDPNSPGIWQPLLDRNGNKIPEDVFGRFYYKYLLRVLYLSDNGPDPTYSNTGLGYRGQLKKIIADFMPALVKFNQDSLTFSNFLGDLPNGGPCKTYAYLGDPYRYSNCFPTQTFDPGQAYFNVIGSYSSRSCVLDTWKKTLYFLYSFLGTINGYPAGRDEALYKNYVNYHMGTDGRPVNIWTQGVVVCPDEDVDSYGNPLDFADEDLNHPCRNSRENDEIDYLAYSMDSFNHFPVDSEDEIGFATIFVNPSIIPAADGSAPYTPPPRGGGGGGIRIPIRLNDIVARIEDGTHSSYNLVDALTGLMLTEDDRSALFESWWYSILYNRCSDPDDVDRCDPAAPKQACEHPDFNDYYDIIGGPAPADDPTEPSLPDDPATIYVQEKSWYQTITDWIPWLEKVRTNIQSASTRIYPGRVCSARNLTCDRCNAHRSYYDKKSCELCHMWALVDNAVTKMKNFKKSIEDFRAAVRKLRDDYEKLQCHPVTATEDEDYKLYPRSTPEYVWNDSLGRHAVKVNVHGYKVPRLKAYRRGCCTKCVKLEHGHQTVSVTVERRDDSNRTSFEGGAGAFWNFWYPSRISYTVSVNYSHHAGQMPVVTSIRKNPE